MRRLVLDTNIILLDANNILTLGKTNKVVVPDTVLAELDAKKSGFEEINFQSREVARLLEESKVVSNTDTTDANTITINIRGVEIQLVTLKNYVADPLSYGGNDRRIIEVAKYLDATLMTNDTHMKFQAITEGIDTVSLKIVDDTESRFVKEVVVDDVEVFRTLHNADILTVDKDYTLEYYSYKFTCETTGQMKLATINNGFISVLGKDTETKLRQQEVAPVGAEQLLMSKAIQDPLIDLVIVEAKSGSGKTVCALSNAMKLMDLHKDRYQSIVYIRNSVDDIGNKDEEVGFLAGNEEKLAVYLHPLDDTLDFIVRKKVITKGKKSDEIEQIVTEKVSALRSKYNIQGMIATGLRGRTLHNTVVIIDEAQNMGTSTMQKVLTRVGKESKVILVGSQNQIDSSFLTKYSNGLAILIDECRQRKLDTEVNMFAINLHKVLRSPLSEFAEDLFTGR